MKSLGKHIATTKRDSEYTLNTYPQTKEFTRRLLKMINMYFNLAPDSTILEIGSAQGKLVAACRSLGYSCEGLEPSEEAIGTSKELSQRLNVDIDIEKGFAEDLPYEDNTFDLVIAISVMEHVRDISKVYQEVVRVLKPDGAFYFTTSSCLCPRQDEIRLFPLFSWYPNKVKKNIMSWAVRNRPGLVGYTETPAINWASPWQTKKRLKNLGFGKIYDRWDLRDISSYSLYQGIMLRTIKLNMITKFLGDFIVPGCGYLAIKK